MSALGLVPQILTKSQREFISAFSRTCSVKRAAKIAGIDRGTHYEWLKTSPEYCEAFEKVQAFAAQVLEDEAVRRAVYGTRKATTVAGEREVQVVYSDALLALLLKAWLPDKYKDRQSVDFQWDGDITKLTEAQFRLVMEKAEQHLSVIEQKQLPEPATIDVSPVETGVTQDSSDSPTEAP